MSSTLQATRTTLLTAPNLTIDGANGITYKYRRYGAPSDLPPLLFLQHFRGNIDNWDPLLVDTIAAQREVVLVDNTGVGATTGSTRSPLSRWPVTCSSSSTPSV